MNQQNEVYNLFVPGRPKAQPRTRKGKYGNIYNPDTADGWKSAIQAYFMRKRREIILGAVSVTADFYFYAPARRRKATSPHTIKPDIDNLVKALLDALKGIGVYKDDCQVYAKFAQKFWTNSPENEGLQISVSEIKDIE